MGFLNNSTNNIMVDAVLTDYGRRLLARGDGSFQITQFSVGDDEVNYDLIAQYGITVGKEKIEKNTPVFEAATKGNYAIKHGLISSTNAYLTHLPTSVASVISAAGTTSTNLTFNRAKQDTSKTVTFIISVDEGKKDIPVEFVDTVLKVELDNRFFEISKDRPSVERNIATYNIRAARSSNTNKEIKTDISLTLKDISDTDFAIYSTTAGESNTAFIKTYIRVTGNNSGTSKIIEASIS